MPKPTRIDQAAGTSIAPRRVALRMSHAHRWVARRDGGLEGELPEPDPMEATQRDLTSLSGPLPGDRRQAPR